MGRYLTELLPMTDNTNAERQARFCAQRARFAKLEQQVRLLQRAAAAPQIDPAPLDNKLRVDLTQEAVKRGDGEAKGPDARRARNRPSKSRRSRGGELFSLRPTRHRAEASDGSAARASRSK